MKKLLVILLCMLPLVVEAQVFNINGRISSSVYTFERFDSVGGSETNIRNYETVALNANYANFSLRTRFMFEAGLNNSQDNDPRLRFYNLYLEARNIFDVATLKVGRQPIITTVAGGIYDAVNLRADFGTLGFQAYYGLNVVPYQKLELVDEMGSNYIFGGKVFFEPVEHLDVAIGYVDKNTKPVDYTAIRLDDNNNPIQVLVENKANQYRFVTGEISYLMPKMFDAYSKLEYDINMSEASRIEVGGRYTQVENLGISASYLYRAPRIPYNSIWHELFEIHNTQEVEVGFDYAMSGFYTLIAKFAHVLYEDENANRYTLGFGNKYGALTYRKSTGAAGEQDGISLNGQYPLFDGFLTPSLGLSYTTYRLTETAPLNNIAAIYAGVGIRPYKQLSIDLQGQYFNNKIYKNDGRVLLKINYWFNTNI